MKPPTPEKPAKTALVICPTFFDYYKTIISEFEMAGFNTVWMNTWLYRNPIYKIFLRMAPHLVAMLSTNRYIRHINNLGLTDVSEVLVVKGEGLSLAFIHYLRHKFPLAKLSLYLWDGIENSGGANRIATAFDAVSTFDPIDASVFNWHYRPLFARNIDQGQPVTSNSVVYDWVFIGTLHSDRFSILKRLVKHRNPQLFYAYAFIPGKFMSFFRWLTNPNIWFQGDIQISTKPIQPERVNQIIRSSKSVLDIEHPKQSGLTMRSVETLLLGRKLVTTNVEIINSDLFHESRVFIIDRRNPIIPQSFFDSTFLDIPPSIRSRYFSSIWLTEVINPPDKTNW